MPWWQIIVAMFIPFVNFIVIFVVLYKFSIYAKGGTTMTNKELEIIYEKENPMATDNFTFEEAAGGCCYAAQQICELDKEYLPLADLNEKKTKQAKYFLGGSNAFVPDESYKCNETEDNKKFRTYMKKRPMVYLVPIVLLLIPFALIKFFPSYKEEITVISIIVFFGVMFVIVNAPVAFYKAILPKDIRKKYTIFPWRFNNQPYGSEMYKIQERLSENQEKTHHLYYSVFLPCKRRAEQLISGADFMSDIYQAYEQLVKNENLELLKQCTPHERVVQKVREKEIRLYKTAGIVTVVTSVVVVAAISHFMKVGTDGTGSIFDNKPRYYR